MAKAQEVDESEFVTLDEEQLKVDAGLELMGDDFAAANVLVRQAAGEITTVEEAIPPMKVVLQSVEVGVATGGDPLSLSDSALQLTLYTSKTNGTTWAKLLINGQNGGLFIKVENIVKHAVLVNGNSTSATVFLRLAEPPALKAKSSDPLPGLTKTTLASYRHLRMTGPVGLKAMWEEWTDLWGLTATGQWGGAIDGGNDG